MRITAGITLPEAPRNANLLSGTLGQLKQAAPGSFRRQRLANDHFKRLERELQGAPCLGWLDRLARIFSPRAAKGIRRRCARGQFKLYPDIQRKLARLVVWVAEHHGALARRPR